MITAGCDPSLRSYGFSVNDSLAIGLERRVTSFHEATLSSSVPVARFIHFQSIVKELIDKYKPDAIGIESPAYGGNIQFVAIHFGLMLFSLVPIFEARIDCVLFDPATLKLLAKEDPKNKKGQMSKLDMQRRVQLLTNDPKVLNDNEADAFLVGYYAARLIGLMKGEIKPEELTPSEKQVFVLRTKKVKTLKGTKIKRIGHVFRANSCYFEYSKIPIGDVALPKKSEINKEIIEFLENLEE